MANGEVSLAGRVAVVTGAGRGLGRAYALALADRGAQVVVNDVGGSPDGHDHDTAPADEVVHSIRRRGGRAVASHDSVATPAGGEAIVMTALETFGRVDVVINNAGILRDGSAAKLRMVDVDAVLDVHLRGAFHVSLPAFRHMRKQEYGRFVFTSSAAGLFGNFGQGNYAAAKMGVVGLSHVLAIEGAEYDIRSNVISPVAGTRLTEEFLGRHADVLTPDHVVPLVTYLASDACGLTHEILSVGGGRLARVFVGVTRGTSSEFDLTSPEAIAGSLPALLDTTEFIVPASAEDELRLLLDALPA